MNNEVRLFDTIQTFLNTEGVQSQMEREDELTVFWSYSLREQRMTGFICIHDNNGCEFLSASVNFGVINPSKGSGVVRMLEENMALHHGLSIATENERLVVVRFSEATELLTLVRVLFLCGQLHAEAEELKNKFVIRERVLDPLPDTWFVSGAHS